MGPVRRILALGLIAALLVSAAGPAYALPSAGEVKHGQATITSSGGTLTVDQATDKIIIHWEDFSIGDGETVAFLQPSASAVALNRVVGEVRSEILGTLTADGRVFLINPNGILFGQGATVDVGGLLASALDITDIDFLNDRYTFALAPGGGGAITVDAGAELSASDGGYIVLLAPEVSNAGTITAQLGTIALGAGGEVTVEFLADGLVELVIDQPVSRAEVNNTGELTAGGGLVVLQAGREDSWLSSVVNQSGTIKAEGVGVRDGRIVLTGGEVGLAGEMTASRAIDVRGETITVESQLDVKTDTSFSLRADGDVVFNDNAHVEALTPRGADDLKVEVILRADADANGTGTVVFDSDVQLTLDGAHAHIFYNPEDPDGDGPGHRYENPTDFTGHVAGEDHTAYMLVNDVHDLQAITKKLDGNYALGQGIDASDTEHWKDDDGVTRGFAPIGSPAGSFTGIFDGQGHVIEGLYINRPDESDVGLFRAIGAGGVVRRIGMKNVEVTGDAGVGGLVGTNDGTVTQSYSTGGVTGHRDVGGLVGANRGTVTQSSANSTVTGSADNSEAIGGLVGLNDAGTIRQSYATGAVSGRIHVGGLVGYNWAPRFSQAYIIQSYATGAVSGQANVGGLVGYNSAFESQSQAHIVQSYAMGAVSGQAHVGGLVGYNSAFGSQSQAHIVQSYATGAVSGQIRVGGLVGYNSAIGFGQAHAEQSYATGAVSGQDRVGGLVGLNIDGTVTASYWNTDTSGQLEDETENGARGKGLTTAQLMTRSGDWFDSWDFEETWAIIEGESYPYFQWRFPQGPHVVSGELEGGFDADKSIGFVQNGAKFAVSAGANDFYYALLDPSEAALFFIVGENGGNLAFRPIAEEHTELRTLVDGLEQNVVRVISVDSGQPLSISELYATIGSIDDEDLLYTADTDGRSIVLKPDVDFLVNGDAHLSVSSVVSNDPAFILDGDIVASTAGSILLQGPVGVAADSRLVTADGTGEIVLGPAVAIRGTPTLTLASGAGGIELAGPVDLGGGDLILDSQSSVTLAANASIKARGLVLLGENVDYKLTHADNAVSILAGEARSIHYEQSGSLTIGSVGGTIGIAAGSTVQVVLTGAESDLTVAQGVSAQGSGYAIVLAAGRRFVNTAGPNPFDTSPDGYYLVFSADHTQRQLGEMASPGNLFGWTYDDDAVGRLVDEFGYTLGNRLVYASRPTLVIAAEDKERHYGDANPEFTYTKSGLVDGDDWSDVLKEGTLTTNADSSSGVGTYDIVESADDPFTSPLGYQVQVIKGTLEITQRPITVTAASPSKVYGDADPALTYTITSGKLVGDDTLSGSLSRDPGEDVGTYAIRQGSLNNPNYAITFVGGTLTITQRPITVTASSPSKVYGDADPVLTYTITSGRLVGDDTLSGSLTRDPGEDVGTYAIRQGSLDNPNYAITFVDGTLTITQRPITVTADSLVKRYGQPDPALTYTITSGSLVGSDTLEGSLTREPGEDFGIYAIEQGTLSHRNYAITYLPGRLAILPGTAALSETYLTALVGVMRMTNLCGIWTDAVSALTGGGAACEEAAGYQEEEGQDVLLAVVD